MSAISGCGAPSGSANSKARRAEETRPATSPSSRRRRRSAHPSQLMALGHGLQVPPQLSGAPQVKPAQLGVQAGSPPWVALPALTPPTGSMPATGELDPPSWPASVGSATQSPASQTSLVAHSPQLWPQRGSTPQERPSQSGMQDSPPPEGAPASTPASAPPSAPALCALLESVGGGSQAVRDKSPRSSALDAELRARGRELIWGSRGVLMRDLSSSQSKR